MDSLIVSCTISSSFVTVIDSRHSNDPQNNQNRTTMLNASLYKVIDRVSVCM